MSDVLNNICGDAIDLVSSVKESAKDINSLNKEPVYPYGTTEHVNSYLASINDWRKKLN